MEKTWQIKTGNPHLKKTLSQQTSLHPLVIHLLLNRGLSSKEKIDNFLNCELTALYDPFLLKDMDKAVGRIKQAIDKKEKIMVYGDYDVDGLTAVALLILTLKESGAEPVHYIPNRLEEGYGLNHQAVNKAHKQGVKLLITVDCGINSKDEVGALTKLGIDTIVTDHHQPQEEFLPKCQAIINPLQKDCLYPYKYLSGVGIAYKLSLALLGNDRKYFLDNHLDLVALGTVADVAPMTQENRILTKHGLLRIKKTKKPGLKALMNIAGLKGKEVSASNVAYILAPRINACGRMGCAEKSLRLLLTDNEDEAVDLAKHLHQENKNRQQTESKILKQAILKIEKEINFKDDLSIVLWDKNWHSGVLGIVASRLVEQFYRPVILISLNEKSGKGSARSIEKFHIFDALNKCRRYLTGFGGHERAAGLTLSENNLIKFKECFDKICRETIKPEDLIPSLDIDTEIPLNLLSFDLLEQIEKLSPFGPENKRPVFCSRDLSLKGHPRAIGESGVKLWVTDGKITCEAVGFRAMNFRVGFLPNAPLNLAYTASISQWHDQKMIQLRLEDLKINL